MSEPKLYSTGGHHLYRSLIRDALNEAKYSYIKDDARAILIWYDNIRKKDFFSGLKPWQIVNRFPSINIICRKAPFIRLLQRTEVVSHYQMTFCPQSFLLPMQNAIFKETVEKSGKKYIIKPDKGSLGHGIKIVEPGEEIPETTRLSVAQEYIPSYLIDDYKFDFRIYVLLASVNPLKIYVYRNGVARFCSKKNTEHSVFAELTNKSLNKKNPDVQMSQIVKMVADVIDTLRQKGHDVNLLWERIDRAIVTTIITALRYLVEDVNDKCPTKGINRCFQILGFDVLLDKHLNPYILEVNYRPSLETNTPQEREMKRSMLADAMRITSPSVEFQKYVIAHYSDDLEQKWDELLETDMELRKIIERSNNRRIDTGKFVLAYPCNSRRQSKRWMNLINVVNVLPTFIQPKHSLPPALRVTGEQKRSVWNEDSVDLQARLLREMAFIEDCVKKSSIPEIKNLAKRIPKRIEQKKLTFEKGSDYYETKEIALNTHYIEIAKKLLEFGIVFPDPPENVKIGVSYFVPPKA